MDQFTNILLITLISLLGSSTYVDMANTAYTGDVVLMPYSSLALINTGTLSYYKRNEMTGLIVLILGSAAVRLFGWVILDDLFDFSEPLKKKKNN